jgi:hypothetical protein
MSAVWFIRKGIDFGNIKLGNLTIEKNRLNYNYDMRDRCLTDWGLSDGKIGSCENK